MTALVAQDYPSSKYEVIAVDNGSSDDSLERLRAFPTVKVIGETTRGSYAARNAGVRESTGSVLAFTDSDCVPEPDWLRGIEAALGAPSCQVVQGRRQDASKTPILVALNRYENARDHYVMSSNHSKTYYGYTNNMALHRSVYRRFGPFIERERGADTIFIRSVVEGIGCKAVQYHPDMIVTHLEMRGVLDHLCKRFIYGHSRKRYSHLMNTETLCLSERLGLLSGVISTGVVPTMRLPVLLAVMGACELAWKAGAMMGAIETGLRQS